MVLLDPRGGSQLYNKDGIIRAFAEFVDNTAMAATLIICVVGILQASNRIDESRELVESARHMVQRDDWHALACLACLEHDSEKALDYPEQAVQSHGFSSRWINMILCQLRSGKRSVRPPD